MGGGGGGAGHRDPRNYEGPSRDYRSVYVVQVMQLRFPAYSRYTNL